MATYPGSSSQRAGPAAGWVPGRHPPSPGRSPRPLGPHDAASAAAGRGIVRPAHDHLALQVHGREAAQEVEGTELEAEDVG